MPLELFIFVIALIPVALRAWLGWRFGAASEMRHLLAALFAVLVSLRYLHQATMTAASFIEVDPLYLAAVAFVLLFGLAWKICGLAINFKGQIYQSVAPNPADNILGGLAGLVSGALLGGSLWIVLFLIFSPKMDASDAVKFPHSLGRFPIAVFRFVERQAGIRSDGLARTPFPQIEAGKDSAETRAVLVWK